ncbi:diguanylate cyclase [Colwellia sp. BRX10-3]|uniref:sensor domain-containing diguanylate cyclase n=1 Tax=Colwellia sp. BRX10-3 TaxID=2759844 RepID=UPI0015F4EED9|nr:diguanylate cyclase [Colwellia sp. BRX10-3]MBA6391527.1 diguanylate cyclase [Colwellia sp. BRX10-3]
MKDFYGLNLKNLLEKAPVGVIIHRWDTCIVYANPTALRLFDLTFDQIVGKDTFDPKWSFVDDTGKKLLIENYPVNKVKRTQKPLKNEIIGVVHSKLEAPRWLMINAYTEGDLNSDNRSIIVSFNDISDFKQLYFFSDIVENTQDIVIVCEADNIKYPTGPKIIYVNKAFETLTGYKKEEVIGETPRILQGDLTDKAAMSRIKEALKNHQAVTETLLNYDINGRPYWIEMNIIPLKNKYGEVTHFGAIERDVSERKFHLEQLQYRNQELKSLKSELEQLVQERTIELQKAKEKLEKIAFLDPLTNIPNRRFFIDQTHRLIKSCDRRQLSIAFGLLDIDDFKVVNDTHGHDAGDLILKELAAYFSGFFRADEAYCRYGGEEFAFAVIIEKASDLDIITDRLIKGICNLKISVNEHYLSVTASAGFKLCHPSFGVDFEQEMKQADVALYQSKKNGKNRVTIIK